MNNPWDRAPLPAIGDQNPAATYEAKGAATCLWEAAEVQFSYLYSALRGGSASHCTTSIEYGTGLNFNQRLSALEAVGKKYFDNNYRPDLHADFLDVVLLSRNFSIRRNEIVHSVVRAVQIDRQYQAHDDGSQTWTTVYCTYLVPPTYTDRKYTAANEPAFIYTSAEINYYRDWFTFIGIAAENLAQRLVNPKLPPFGRKHPEPQFWPSMDQIRPGLGAGWIPTQVTVTLGKPIPAQPRQE